MVNFLWHVEVFRLLSFFCLSGFFFSFLLRQTRPLCVEHAAISCTCALFVSLEFISAETWDNFRLKQDFRGRSQWCTAWWSTNSRPSRVNKIITRTAKSCRSTEAPETCHRRLRKARARLAQTPWTKWSGPWTRLWCGPEHRGARWPRRIQRCTTRRSASA